MVKISSEFKKNFHFDQPVFLKNGNDFTIATLSEYLDNKVGGIPLDSTDVPRIIHELCSNNWNWNSGGSNYLSPGIYRLIVSLYGIPVPPPVNAIRMDMIDDFSMIFTYERSPSYQDVSQCIVVELLRRLSYTGIKFGDTNMYLSGSQSDVWIVSPETAKQGDIFCAQKYEEVSVNNKRAGSSAPKIAVFSLITGDAYIQSRPAFGSCDNMAEQAVKDLMSGHIQPNAKVADMASYPVCISSMKGRKSLFPNPTFSMM